MRRIIKAAHGIRFIYSDNYRLFTIPDASNYTGAYNQQLPPTSKYVVVGASLVPCFMVKHSQASDYTKIHNSLYYTLVKEEYWGTATHPST